MDEKLQQYWKTHKKCIHCKYLKYHHHDVGIEYYECIAKDKRIEHIFLRRFFCPMFNLNKE